MTDNKPSKLKAQMAGTGSIKQPSGTEKKTAVPLTKESKENGNNTNSGS